MSEPTGPGGKGRLRIFGIGLAATLVLAVVAGALLGTLGVSLALAIGLGVTLAMGGGLGRK